MALAYIDAATLLAMAIVSVVRYDVLSKDFRILSLFFVGSVINTSLQFYTSMHNINNMVLLHLYTLSEYAVLMYVMSLWQKKVIMMRAFRLSIAAFFVIWGLAKIFIEDHTRFDTFTSPLANFTITCAAVYTMVFLYRENRSTLIKNARFWIISAIIVYYSGNIVFFAFTNILLSYSAPQIMFVWSIHWFIGIITNLLYSEGFLCKRLP